MRDAKTLTTLTAGRHIDTQKSKESPASSRSSQGVTPDLARTGRRQPSNPIQLDHVRPRGAMPPRQKPRRAGRPKQKQDFSKKKQWTWCGRGSHSHADCPARDAVCHKCHKKGHYSEKCYSKSVIPSHNSAGAIDEESLDVDDNFVDAVVNVYKVDCSIGCPR